MLGFGMPGMWEWGVILVLVLIFFGVGKLPSVFAQAGKGLKAFKDASEGRDTDALTKDTTEDDEPQRPRKQLVRDADELDDEPPEEGAVTGRKERRRHT